MTEDTITAEPAKTESVDPSLCENCKERPFKRYFRFIVEKEFERHKFCLECYRNIMAILPANRATRRAAARDFRLQRKHELKKLKRYATRLS